MEREWNTQKEKDILNDQSSLEKKFYEVMLKDGSFAIVMLYNNKEGKKQLEPCHDFMDKNILEIVKWRQVEVVNFND